MKIALAGIHYPICSLRYLADAFRREGHDVRTLGFAPNHLWGVGYDPRWTFNPTGHLTQAWFDWIPHMVIIAESAWPYHHPIYDVPHVVFGADNHVRDYRGNSAAHYFLAHKGVTVQPYDENTTWLPGSYDPVYMRPSPILYNEREYDVCLIGYPYPQREAAVQRLRAAGVSVYANAGLLYTDYVAAYHQARMSLCVSSNHDVGQRIFETAAMGCLILTDHLPDLAALDAPKEIETWRNVDDLLALVDYYRDNPDLAQEAIEVTQAWAAPFTWDQRARAIAAWYNKTYLSSETGQTE